MLLGKLSVGLDVDRNELEEVFSALGKYGDPPGSSFFLIREGLQASRQGRNSDALTALGKAIERTPTLVAPHFMRAHILLELHDIPGAESDLREINRILSQGGACKRC